MHECPTCSFLLEMNAKECRFCGEDFVLDVLESEAEERVHLTEPPPPVPPASPLSISMVAAVILGLLLVVIIV